MFKLAIEVCFENFSGLIHAMFLLLGSTKSVYFPLGHPVFPSFHHFITLAVDFIRNYSNFTHTVLESDCVYPLE